MHLAAELPKDFSPPKRYLHLNYITKLFSVVNGRGGKEDWTHLGQNTFSELRVFGTFTAEGTAPPTAILP